MPRPATKTAAYAEELGERWRPVGELRLRQIGAELERSLRVLSPEEAQLVHSLLGHVNEQLGKYDAALRHLEIANRLGPDPFVLTGLGNVFALLGRTAEAIDAWVKASEIGGGSARILSNLVEGFAALGREADAWATLREAIQVARPSDLGDLFALAAAAAELGGDDLAVEFFARFLSIARGKGLGREAAIDFVRRELGPDEIADRELEAAVHRMLAFGQDLSAYRGPPGRGRTVGEDATASALEVFERTRAMRARATRAAMSEAQDGEG